jgi:hypothetical protein
MPREGPGSVQTAVIVSLWTPYAHAKVASRWFSHYLTSSSSRR